MSDFAARELQFRRAGIAEGYFDAFGEWRHTPPATREAILRALGPAARRPDKPAEPGGPKIAFLPRTILGGARLWGFPIQLYGLRSRRNWGIGDFTDLANFVDAAADLGAEAVGLNPLHALFPGNAAHISPYAPSSRIFRNMLYLDVEAIPDLQASPGAHELIATGDFQRGIRGLREALLVDHVGVAAHKRPVLELLYSHFRAVHLAEDGGARSARGRAFRRYQEAGGDELERYGRFEAIAERLGSEARANYHWRAWPAELQSPDSPGVLSFAAVHRARVEFHHYVQWEIDRQLAAAQARCRQRDMAVGLLHDLAVGFDGSGADSWLLQGCLCSGMSLGAPPDHLSPNGQDWGFPPFNPFALRSDNYAPFIETLRANMAHGGGLRIDHILGFARQYWVPHGTPATAGGYIEFPVDDLLAGITRESHRAGCLVVGEDLGTVPDGFRERLAHAQLLSYRLAYFERDASGGLPAPHGFPRLALVAAGTHDLPTLAGYWRGRDIDLRRALGFFDTYDIEGELRVDRDRDRAAIWHALVSAGLVAGDLPPAAGPEVASALYAYLARTPSCLLMVNPDDLLAVEEQVNLPGASDGHPNWRRRMAISIEAFASDRRIATACSSVDLIRRAAAA